jgi:NADH-quinone oxidoreductase subunit J
MLHILLLAGLVAFCVVAVLSRDLLKSAISLAVASVFLALVFFDMGAAYAGVFEVSVVAGLITVLFITAIALTRNDGDVQEGKAHRFVFPLFFLALAAIDLLVMKRLLGQVPSIQGSESGSFGEVLWNQRTFDLIGQVGVIFAGVLAVLALFRSEDETNGHGGSTPAKEGAHE